MRISESRNAPGAPSSEKSVDRASRFQLLTFALFMGVLLACDSVTTAVQPPRKSLDGLVRQSKSPLEGTTFTVELSYETRLFRGKDTSDIDRHTETFTVPVTVVRGSGYADLSFLQSAGRAAPKLHILETTSGRVHGSKSRRSSHLSRQKRLLGLDVSAGRDGGPLETKRISQDGETVMSTESDWKRDGEVWELQRAVFTTWDRGQPVTRTLVRVKVKRDKALADLTSPSHAARLTLAVADGLRAAGRAALDVFVPPSLYAQEPTDDDQHWWDDVETAIMAAGVILGAVIAYVWAAGSVAIWAAAATLMAGADALVDGMVRVLQFLDWVSETEGLIYVEQYGSPYSSQVEKLCKWYWDSGRSDMIVQGLEPDLSLEELCSHPERWGTSQPEDHETLP